MENFKQELIDYVENNLDLSVLSEEAKNYWKDIKENKNCGKLTEKGKVIIKAMLEMPKEAANANSAKSIANYIQIPARSVSGCMKKLVSDGYVVKKSLNNIVFYELTEKSNMLTF